MDRTTEFPSQQNDVLAEAKRGDRAAFSKLMEPHRRELIAYCYRLTRGLSEAEDLTQEVFVRAFRSMRSFEGRASTRAWLYKIAHNLCLNHVQRTKQPWESLEDVHANAASVLGAENASQGREDVRLGFVALLQSLPPRQRAALVLRDVLGWSAEETARILDVTVPSVKNALSRARNTLSEQRYGDDVSSVVDETWNSPEARILIAQWVEAFEKGNTVKMVELLTQSTTHRRKVKVRLSN